MRKTKNLVNGALRLGGITVFDICLYSNEIDKFLWFFIGCVLVVWIIPFVVTKIIFTKQVYDGTFLIDETDPTDVKFKLTFDTDPDEIAYMKDISIKVDHREVNKDFNGGDNNGF